MNQKDLWLSAIKELSSDINRTNVITWFKNTAILENNSGEVVIGLPLPVFLDWHKKKYAESTLSALQKVSPEIKKITYLVDLTLVESDPRVIDLLKYFPSKTKRKLPNKSELKINGKFRSKIFSSRYSLDNFIVSPQNRLAHAASLTVAKFPGQNYNPLFLFGNVGLGKTHLLQSIGKEALRNDPDKVIVYTTTESFANELIDGIQERKMNRFRNKYRNVDILMIDDIQFIANKDKTQEEFFHTFNTLYEAGKQMVISSDRPPAELKLFSERLISRFESGMLVELKMPDFEGRMQILEGRCQEAQVIINRKILELIAYNSDQSVRQLIGVLNQVIARYELENLAPTIQSVTQLLQRSKEQVKEVGFKSISKKPEGKSVTLDCLIDKVSDYFTVPKDEILGNSRTREYVVPRQIIMYLAKSKLQLSLNRIGEGLGKRNHTTVMHAITKVKNQIKSNHQLLCDINAISKEVGIA